MGPRRHRRLLFLALGSLALWGTSPAFPADTTPAAGVQSTMQALFRALSSVVPWSLQEQQFQAPEHRQAILEALTVLAQNAAQLQSHTQDAPPSFDFLRRALSRSAQDAAQQYAQGQYRPARYLFQQLTEHCFACHSRLPSARTFDLGQRFLAETKMESLPIKARVTLAVATRQFDTAVRLCETWFQSPDVSAAEVGLTGMFEDYLKIILRVRHDFSHAAATLETFRQRPDVPPYLRDDLASWVATLQELQTTKADAPPVAQAKALIDAGQRRNRFPADHRGLVHFMVASSLLHRYVDSRPTDQTAVAEAYYLLGVAESYVSRASWVSETGFFLEMAIRLAPQTPIAAQAYDVLNAYILNEYTGSSGLHLPQEMQEYLDTLRRLRGGS